MEKKWFLEKLGKNFDLENFRSESFSIRTSCTESSRFQARVAKGRPRPAFRDCITGGKPRVQNCVSRGRYGLRKTEKIFLANNEQSSMNRGKKWFSEKLGKKILT